ncbi:conjugal transfer protein [Mycobacterium sp. ML2]
MKLNRTWQGRASATSSTTRRTLTVALVVLAALSGLHTVWQFMFGEPTNVVEPARVVVNKSAVVASLAEDYVTTWLTATSATAGALTQFASLSVSELHLPSTPAVVVGAPTVVAVTFEGTAGKGDSAEVFSVVVGVNERPYESATPTRSLYRVPVLWSRFGARATGLPFRVEGPGPGADLKQTYPTPLSATEPAFQATSGFLTAYLTGTGDVARYVTTDSMLTGLGAPYLARKDESGNPLPLEMTVQASASVASQPSEGETVQVMAHVTAQTSQYANVAMSYPLILRGVGGHWSVAGISRAPSLSTDDELVPVVTTMPRPSN